MRAPLALAHWCALRLLRVVWGWQPHSLLAHTRTQCGINSSETDMRAVWLVGCFDGWFVGWQAAAAAAGVAVVGWDGWLEIM